MARIIELAVSVGLPTEFDLLAPTIVLTLPLSSSRPLAIVRGGAETALLACQPTTR